MSILGFGVRKTKTLGTTSRSLQSALKEAWVKCQRNKLWETQENERKCVLDSEKQLGCPAPSPELLSALLSMAQPQDPETRLCRQQLTVKIPWPHIRLSPAEEGTL